MTYATRVRRNPLRVHAAAMINTERALADLQRQLFPTTKREEGSARSFVPALRAVENAGDYVVTADIPGVSAEDLSVVVEDGVLTLSGTRKSLDWSEDLEDAEKEALVSNFERSVRFNGEIDEDRVTARSRDGLLRVVIPKPEPPVSEPTRIPVQAG